MLQNKKLSDVKLQIFKNFSLLDVALLLIFTAISFSLGFLTKPSLHLAFKIIISFGIFLSLGW
ncbi:Uncharacterised protein, partial [Metamycoplasma alkalescens]